jgi:hypothetical protein
MSQNTAKQMLLECLALAQKTHESPRLEDGKTTSNDNIDPRLLALSHPAAVQEEAAHASSSTASDCIDPQLLALSHDGAVQEEDVHASSSTANGSAASRGNYFGSPLDDDSGGALPESG